MKTVEINVSFEDFKKMDIELVGIFCYLEDDNGIPVPALKLGNNTYLVLKLPPRKSETK